MNFATLHFDTYKVVNLLVSKGYTKDEAEGFIEAIQEVTLSGVATKHDIDDLKQDINGVKKEMHDLRMSTKTEIAHQKIWFLGAMLTQTIALIAVILSM